MMAAAGRRRRGRRARRRGAQRAELLERRGDRVAAALGAGWLASARLRRGEFAECLPALLTAMRGLQHRAGPVARPGRRAHGRGGLRQVRELRRPVWKFHVIEQTQLRRQHRVDGVGRPKFDLHTGADDDRSRDDATAPLLSVAANVWAAQGRRRRSRRASSGPSLPSRPTTPSTRDPTPRRAATRTTTPRPCISAAAASARRSVPPGRRWRGRRRRGTARRPGSPRAAPSWAWRATSRPAWKPTSRRWRGTRPSTEAREYREATHTQVEAEEAFRNAAVARGGLTANTSPFGAVAVEAAEALEMDDDDEEESPRPPRAWQPPPRRLACAAAALAAGARRSRRGPRGRLK